MTSKKPPVIVRSPLTNRIFFIRAYKDLGEGRIEATGKKEDITAQFTALHKQLLDAKMGEIRKLLEPIFSEAEGYFPSKMRGYSAFLNERRYEGLSHTDHIRVNDLFALYEYFKGPITDDQ
jgi:hypothetical protein